MSKIKLDVIKPWIQDKLTEMLKIDDDVVVDFVYNQLEEKVGWKTIYFFFLYAISFNKQKLSIVISVYILAFHFY